FTRPANNCFIPSLYLAVHLVVRLCVAAAQVVPSRIHRCGHTNSFHSQARPTARTYCMMRLDLKRRRFDEPSSIADRPKHGDREGAHNFKLEGERADSRGLDRSEARIGPEARVAALCPEAQGFLAPAIRLKLIAGVMPAHCLPILNQRCFDNTANSFLDSIGQNANNS